MLIFLSVVIATKTIFIYCHFTAINETYFINSEKSKIPNLSSWLASEGASVWKKNADLKQLKLSIIMNFFISSIKFENLFLPGHKHRIQIVQQQSFLVVSCSWRDINEFWQWLWETYVRYLISFKLTWHHYWDSCYFICFWQQSLTIF